MAGGAVSMRWREKAKAWREQAKAWWWRRTGQPFADTGDPVTGLRVCESPRTRVFGLMDSHNDLLGVSDDRTAVATARSYMAQAHYFGGLFGMGKTQFPHGAMVSRHSDVLLKPGDVVLDSSVGPGTVVGFSSGALPRVKNDNGAEVATWCVWSAKDGLRVFDPLRTAPPEWRA